MKLLPIVNEHIAHGLIHGIMHKGTHNQNPNEIDMVYVCVSSTIAMYSLHSILRKRTVPTNMISCGFNSITRETRGRTLSPNLTLFISSEVLLLDVAEFASSLASMINEMYRRSINVNLVTNFDITRQFKDALNRKLFATGLNIPKHYHTGALTLKSSLSVKQFLKLVDDTVIPIERGDIPKLKAEYPKLYLGEEFLNVQPAMLAQCLDRIIKYLDMSSESIVCHPDVMTVLYSSVFSPLAVNDTTSL